MSAASLATSVAVSTEIPTSASWRATASLTPSPRNPTVAPSARCALMTRDFCAGVTRAKIVVCGRAAASAASSSRSSWAPVRVPRDLAGRDRQTLWRDAVVVAGDHLDLDLEPPQPRERVGCVGLRGVLEAQKTGEGEAVLVVGRQACLALGGPDGYGDNAAALRELCIEHRLSLLWNVPAAREDYLGRALDDYRARSVGVLDQNGGDAAFVVEWPGREPPGASEVDRARGGRLPERLIERRAAHDVAVADDCVVAQQAQAEGLGRCIAGGVEGGSEADRGPR